MSLEHVGLQGLRQQVSSVVVGVDMFDAHDSFKGKLARNRLEKERRQSAANWLKNAHDLNPDGSPKTPAALISCGAAAVAEKASAEAEAKQNGESIVG